jgi:hypothetical protein
MTSLATCNVEIEQLWEAVSLQAQEFLSFHWLQYTINLSTTQHRPAQLNLTLFLFLFLGSTFYIAAVNNTCTTH